MIRKIKAYIFDTEWLTPQERRVIQTVTALLLIGWAVKTYRTAHPAATVPTITQVQAEK